jgi:hypothetical protein
MYVKTMVLAAAFSVAPGLLYAQFDFKVEERDVQVHSFASQGFAYSNDNNYLTMNTSQGSFAMTDGGVNVSTQLTDKFRVGGQVYIRDFGRLGQWHPQLDWAYADYRFKDWFGVRGGKVKTVLGLFNDTQDNDSLHTFALLPQSVYPTDLRDSTIGHTGADLYGNVELKRLGSISYTVFVGHRQDTRYGGYSLMVQDRGINMSTYGGLQYGGDLKWSTPIKNLVLGGSHLIEDVTGTGKTTCNQAKASVNCALWTSLTDGNYKEYSNKDYSNYFYGEYTIGNLRLDSEYRRYWRDQAVWNGLWDVWADTRGWYTSAAYRISKRLELGTYYSRFTCKWISGGLGPNGPTVKPPSLDTSLPGNHIYDKVVTARFDLNRWWNVKLEGHFMDGYGTNQSPDGFYDTSNPQGYKPKTAMLMVRTGWSF